MKYLLIIFSILVINLTQNYSQVKDSNSLIVCGTDIDPVYIYCGNSIIGPVVGYSLKSKVLSYGFNYEYAFSQNKTGIFTAGIAGKFNTNKEDIFDNSAVVKTTNISLALQSNFNFNRLPAKAIIPFVGILLGYNYSVNEYNFNSGINNPLYPDTKRNSLYFFSQAGIRFFFSRHIALTFKAGTGNIDKSYIECGIDLGL